MTEIEGLRQRVEELEITLDVIRSHCKRALATGPLVCVHAGKRIDAYACAVIGNEAVK